MSESAPQAGGVSTPSLQPSEEFVAQMKDLSAKADACLGKDNEQAEALALSVLQLSRENQYLTGEELALFLLGAVEYYRNNYNPALKWAQEAKCVTLKTGNRNLAFRIANMMGGIHDACGNIEASLKAGLEGLSIAEENGSIGQQAVACLNLGIHYREGGEYDKAIEYLFKGLEFERNTPTQDRLAWILSVIGSVWIMKEDYSKALDYLEQSLVLSEQLEKDAIRSDVLNALGVVYVRLRNLEEASRYHNEALAQRRKMGERNLICGSLTNLGLLAHEKRDFDDAISKYLEALAIAVAIGSKKNEERIHNFLTDTYESMGNYKLALEHAHIAKKLGDEMRQGAMEEMEQRLRAEEETKRAKTEAELHRIKEYELAEAQRIANLGSWQYDPDTSSFTGSVEFCRLLGINNGESTVSMPRFLQRFHPADCDQFMQSFDLSVARHTALDIIVRGSHDRASRGAAFHFIGQWGAANGSGLLQFFGTLQDVTQQLEADDVRHEKERLQGMLEMAGAFSHEINQPLQVITTSADLIQQVYGDQKDLAAHAKRVLDAIDRIHDISSRLTSVSKYRTKEYVKGVNIIDFGREAQQDLGE